MAGTNRTRQDWVDVAPGLGLVIGAGIAMLLSLLLSGGAGWLATSIAIGGGVGLVAGSVVRLRRRPR